MDVYLDDKSSLHLLRKVSTDPRLELRTTGEQCPMSLGSSPVNLHRMGMPHLLSYLRVPENGSLGVLVPAARHRVRAHGTSCSVKVKLPGDCTFMLLTNANDYDPSLLVPQDSRVFVMPPECVVLGMAGRLMRGGASDKDAWTKNVLMLTKLCLELCGTYRHDPFDPWKGSVTYEVPPLTSADVLRALSACLHGERGARLYKEAIQHVYDLSGSPQESFMGPALFFSSAYGGLDLGEFDANKPLDLSKSELASIDCRTITPDFFLSAYDLALEYLGSIHKEGDNPKKDHVRSLDYQTLGKRELAFVYDDVKTRDAFMHSAARIVTIMEQFDGPGVRTRFERLKGDQAFVKRQKQLFQTFRPWLR